MTWREQVLSDSQSSWNECCSLQFIFHTLPFLRTGSIGFPEFVEWLLLITSENVHDRLRWGFQICDVDCSGRVSAAEVTALIRLMFGVLTGLELDPNNPYVGDLVSSLFQNPYNSTSGRVSGQKEGATVGEGGREDGGRVDGEEGEKGGKEDSLSWEQYRRGCLESADVMTVLSPLTHSYRKGYYGGQENLKSPLYTGFT
jgi:hypothetical protein